MTTEANQLEEADFDGFTELVNSLKDGGGDAVRRGQWLSFVRTLCRPYFNHKEPTSTGIAVFMNCILRLIINGAVVIIGSTLQVYDERVALIAEKIQLYIFVHTHFKYKAMSTKGRVELTYCHQMTLAGEDCV